MIETYTLGRRAKQPKARGFDPSTRMLDFVLATETPCPALRFDPETGCIIEVSEILVASGCANVATMDGPILNAHDRSSLEKQLGKIRTAKVVGSEVVCTAIMSERPDVRAFYTDIADGIIDSMSVGYTCLGEEWDRTTTPITVRVVKWTGDEGSMVPIPADQSAKIRAERAARAAPPTPSQTEATMTPDALDAAFKAFGDSFSAALGGFRSALATTTTPAPAPVAAAVAAPAAPAAPAAVTVNVNGDGTRAAPAAPAAGARSEDEGGGDEGEDDGDGTGGDAEERKAKRAAMLKDLRTAMGSRSSDQLDALVRQHAPAAAIRQAAFAAMRSAVGRPATLTPPAGAVAGGAGKRDTLIPFGERAKRAPAKVR